MSVSNFDSIGARRRRRRRRDNVAAAAAAEANLHGFKSSDRLEANKSEKFPFSDSNETFFFFNPTTASVVAETV